MLGFLIKVHITMLVGLKGQVSKTSKVNGVCTISINKGQERRTVENLCHVKTLL